MTPDNPSRRSRRKEVLRELGLGPLWRARAPMGPSAAQDTIAPAFPADAIAGRVAAIRSMDWSELEASVAACTACGLCRSRTHTVFGVGDRRADWLCVGEGPGAEEDARGEPFVGPSGRLLDNMLAAVGLMRGRGVYIANIVKCRPPGNRNPAPDEMEQCAPYLARQIELIQPRLIVTLGRIAAQKLLHTDASIASLRGRLHRHAGIPVIVTYHPAYLLRTLADKAKVWEDLCFARSTMQDLMPAG